MKKTLILALCLLFCSFLKAQTFTSGHITVVMTDSLAHDSTTCMCTSAVSYNITIDSSYTGETLYIVDTASGSLVGSSPYVNTLGASPWIFTAPNIGGYGWTDIDMLGGLPGYAYFNNGVQKVVCGSDTLRYINLNDSLYVPNPCQYDTIQGYFYADNNSDCIFNAGDTALTNLFPNIFENLSSSVDTLNNAYEGFPNSNGMGWYMYMVQKSWMVNYTVSLPAYYTFIFPFSSCFTTTSYTFTTLPQNNVSFPLQCSSLIDVQCNALAPGSIRLHRDFFLQPYVSNTGCDYASGTLTFIKDSRVIYDSALSVYPADTVRGDTLIWNYNYLSNLSGGAYWNSFLSSIYCKLDSTVVAGDTLCFSGYTNIPAGDINPYNNSFAFCVPVVYSYDPNEKEVSPVGAGSQGYIPYGIDTLSYTLHFQNTGSAEAQNIVVIDTLDSHLNAKTLKILGTSAQMIPQWLAPNVIAFNFNNINLPDSGSNYAGSQGQVRFSIALNAGLPYGTQIYNTGYIYFDLNPAVVTNTTLNTIAKPNKVDNIIAATGVYVYPNPATDHITVENLEGGELTIMNINGEVVMKQNVANNKTTIDVSGLAEGVYLLKTFSNTNTATTKFTKY